MKITCGGQTIQTGIPRADAIYKNGVRCPALRIPLPQGVSADQLAALTSGSLTILTDLGEPIPGGTHEGYNTLIGCEAVIAKVLSADQRAAQAEAQAAAAQAETREQLAILRGTQEGGGKPELAAMRAALDSYVALVADDAAAINGCLDAIRDWTPGGYRAGDVRLYDGAPYKCVQAHDSGPNPNWTPVGYPAGWAQYHGTTPGTARPWAAPSGAHDQYKAGEYMIWTDGQTYKCLTDADRGPDAMPDAWAAEA